MHEPLNDGKPLPTNAIAVWTTENGWEYLPDLVAQRDRLLSAAVKIANGASTLEDTQELALNAIHNR